MNVRQFDKIIVIDTRLGIFKETQKVEFYYNNQRQPLRLNLTYSYLDGLMPTPLDL